ncbi:MAG: DUF3048 domain-containing protein [Chloroflexi bacterium]|nr:DUF3048 domain-containing protein [Chloroflexota bacterium]
MTKPAPGLTRRAAWPVLVGGLVIAAIAVGAGAGLLLAGSLGSASATAGPSPLAPSASRESADPSPSEPTSAARTPAPTSSPQPTPVLVAAPLTGLPVLETSARQHPIAVMIDDLRAARPQSGFNAAAQVWQAPAEGGIPRYMMIFQDTLPVSVGPVRSARQYFIEWAAEWKALYVHVGGSGQAMSTLAGVGRGQWVYNADGFRFEGTGMSRIKERAAPHNVYSDAGRLRAMAATVGANDGPLTPVWAFGGPTPLDSRPGGTTITIDYPYETITYRYNPGTDRYVRYVDRSSTPQVDAADGQPIAPTNVVILRMRFGPLNDGHPEKNRLEAQDVGSGEAIISTGGRIIHGTWSKASETAPTLLFGPDGAAATLAAGQTYVQVIALSYAYSIVEGTLSSGSLREF